jgi:hypothetical protein
VPATPIWIIAKLLQKLAVTKDIAVEVRDSGSNESIHSADAGDKEVDNDMDTPNQAWSENHTGPQGKANHVWPCSSHQQGN